MDEVDQNFKLNRAMALGKNMNLITESEEGLEAIGLLNVASEQKKTVSSIVVGLKPSNTDRNKIVLEISGRLTIENVELIKDKIELATIQYEKVELFLHQVTALDLTVVQLFHYIQKEAANDGQVVTIVQELPEEINQLLTKCGLEGFEPKSVQNL